jgi:cell shape-determining protein MreC
MSYLLDKKLQKKRFINISLGVIVLVVLFFFRTAVFNGLSYASQKIFSPVLVAGNSVGQKWGSIGAYFISKNSLFSQNQKLLSELDENNARMINYNSLLAENASLKEILNRKNIKTTMTLAAILSKPNQSIYDTLTIDVGESEGVKVNNVVFAFGDMPIGRVSAVYPNSSKVILFSTPGEITEGLISSAAAGQAGNPASTSASLGGNSFLELTGRGGGNFEMLLPRDLTLQKGDQILLPGINNYVLAIAETVISDPRDPFTKALLRSPVNVEGLKFVQIEQ